MGMKNVGAFLKEEGTSLIFKGDGELVFYIPENYFRNDGHMKYAEEAGEYVNTLGLFSTGQWLSIPFIIAGILLLFAGKKRV